MSWRLLGHDPLREPFMSVKKICSYLLFCLVLSAHSVFGLPEGFVYLRDIAPTIRQEMRYAGYHNFVGRPIKGYQVGECVLTSEAAQVLSKVQAELAQSRLSLK